METEVQLNFGSGQKHPWTATNRVVIKRIQIKVSRKSINILIADFFDLPEKFDRVQSIRFSCNAGDSGMFVATSRNGISFGQWVCLSIF